MRTASAAAKPCQGDSLELYLITGSIYTDQRGTVVIARPYFDEVDKDHFRPYQLNITNTKPTSTLPEVVQLIPGEIMIYPIATCSYPTDKHKDIMKAQVHVSRLLLLSYQTWFELRDLATIIAQQLQNIIPQIVTQVTANVNNGNGGNGNSGNNGCSYKTFTSCP
ncbi:hypothetical protein Tco_0731979 [Tanacetum coccineum]